MLQCRVPTTHVDTMFPSAGLSGGYADYAGSLYHRCSYSAPSSLQCRVPTIYANTVYPSNQPPRRLCRRCRPSNTHFILSLRIRIPPIRQDGSFDTPLCILNSLHWYYGFFYTVMITLNVLIGTLVSTKKCLCKESLWFQPHSHAVIVVEKIFSLSRARFVLSVAIQLTRQRKNSSSSRPYATLIVL